MRIQAILLYSSCEGGGGLHFDIIFLMEAPVLEFPKNVEYEFLKDPQVRDALKRKTIELVEDTQDIDVLFFLDRSARPLAHLYRRFLQVIDPERQRPEIRFLNIGQEKHGERKSFYDRGVNHLRTRDDLVKMYGEDNIAKLEHQFDKPTGERRMIVDDVFATGSSLQVARAAINSLDSDHEYTHFFTYGEGITRFPDILAKMPWDGDDTFVKDKSASEGAGYRAKDSGFLTIRNDDPKQRKQGIQLRAELEKLASEFATEKGVSLPPIHPFWEKPKPSK